MIFAGCCLTVLFVIFYGAFLWNDPDQGLQTMITQLKVTNKPYTVVQIEFRVSFHTP